MTAKKQSKEPTFEQDLASLESLAERMESGDLTLEELLTAYEEGTKLSKTLMDRLKTAQEKLMEVKAAKDGELSVTASAVTSQGSLLDELEP